MLRNFKPKEVIEDGEETQEFKSGIVGREVKSSR